MNGEIEAEVGAGEAPRGLEVVDVASDEAQVRRVGGRERQVVAAERVVGEVPDHRPGLEAEEHGRKHREQAGKRVVGRELTLVDLGLELGLERTAQRGGERFEDGAQRASDGGRPIRSGRAPAPGHRGSRPGR